MHDEDEEDEDSFIHCDPNLELEIGDEDEARLTGQLPTSKVKSGMKPQVKQLKVNMSKKAYIDNSFESKLKDGDLQKLSNAIVMEVNSLAAQLFELISLFNELVLAKPKRIQKMLADTY